MDVNIGCEIKYNNSIKHYTGLMNLSSFEIVVERGSGIGMGWKCVPQLIGLVRGDPESGKKHRANGLKICEEAGIERKSRSVALDRLRSWQNEYRYCQSGADCWEAMEADAEEYRITGVNKNGRVFSRRLRADAKIGWALIFHPSEEVAWDWPLEKIKDFIRDSWRVMYNVEPRLFRQENIRMLAMHRDEGVDHGHVIGCAKDQDGHYCGNLIDAMLFVRINREYPALMRRFGWKDIVDTELVDFSRMRKNEDGTYYDPVYRAEIDARKKEKRAGVSVSRHMVEKARKEVEAAARMYEDAQRVLAEAQRMEKEAADRLLGIDR